MRLDEIEWTNKREYWWQADVYGLSIARAMRDGALINHTDVPEGTFAIQVVGDFEIINPAELQCLLYQRATELGHVARSEPGRDEGANTEKAVPSPARALMDGA